MSFLVVFFFFGVVTWEKNKNKSTKINATYSWWQEILFGVPHGSILGLLLVNLFLCDLFWIMCETDFSSYADYNTHYRLRDSIDDVIKLLEDDSMNLFNWQPNESK